jgi:hypothetical protein
MVIAFAGHEVTHRPQLMQSSPIPAWFLANAAGGAVVLTDMAMKLDRATEFDLPNITVLCFSVNHFCP